MVNIEEFVDMKVKDEDLDLEQGVIFRHTAQLIHDIARYTQSPQILGAANAISRRNNVYEFIHHSLTIYEFVSQLVDPVLGNSESRETIQEIFEERDLTKQLQKLCMAYMVMRKRMDIINKLEARAASEHRERAQEEGDKAGPEGTKGGYRESLKAPVDERVSDVKRFRKNMEGKTVPPLAQKRFEEEINRYLSMDARHSESAVIRTYLDYLTSLPWGTTTTDSFDILKAKRILDEGHYGMDDIKQRILEFLAVGKLQGKVQGKILCFVGPPGVGKTSIGASIAK